MGLGATDEALVFLLGQIDVEVVLGPSHVDHPQLAVEMRRETLGELRRPEGRRPEIGGEHDRSFGEGLLIRRYHDRGHGQPPEQSPRDASEVDRVTLLCRLRSTDDQRVGPRLGGERAQAFVDRRRSVDLELPEQRVGDLIPEDLRDVVVKTLHLFRGLALEHGPVPGALDDVHPVEFVAIPRSEPVSERHGPFAEGPKIDSDQPTHARAHTSHPERLPAESAFDISSATPPFR